MDKIQVYKHPQFGAIRTVVRDGDPWFVGKDLCDALGYTNSRKALADHVDEEDKGVTNCYTPGGMQNMTVINESGMYALIFSSRLEGARAFKRWVTSEVLPSIRKTGVYKSGKKPLTNIDNTDSNLPPSELQAMREALGLSRPELARLSGFARCSIWLWETGGRNPTQESIAKIREALQAENERQGRFVDDALAQKKVPGQLGCLTVHRPDNQNNNQGEAQGNDQNNKCRAFTITQNDVKGRPQPMNMSELSDSEKILAIMNELQDLQQGYDDLDRRAKMDKANRRSLYKRLTNLSRRIQEASQNLRSHATVAWH